MTAVLRLRLRPSPNGPVVIARGQLAGSTVPSLLNVVEAVLRIRSAPVITIDLQDATLLDRGGAEGLLAAQRLSQHAGRTLRVTRASAQVVAALRAHLRAVEVRGGRLLLPPRCLTNRRVPWPRAIRGARCATPPLTRGIS